MQAIQQAMKKALWAGLAAALVVVAGAQSAEAGSIRVFVNGGFVTQVNDLDGDGIINFASSSGVFNTITVTAITKPQAGYGSPTEPFMYLNVSATSTAAGQLLVEFSEDDFGTSGQPLVAGTTTILPPGGSTFAYQTFQGTDNLLFSSVPTGTFLTSQNSNGFANFNLTDVTAYSLSQQIVLNHGSASPLSNPSNPNSARLPTNSTNTLSIDGQRDVPDGGSTAALLGSALMALGLVRRRFSKR